MAYPKSPNNNSEGKEFRPSKLRKERRIGQQSIRNLLNKAAGSSITDLEEDLDELEESLKSHE